MHYRNSIQTSIRSNGCVLKALGMLIVTAIFSHHVYAMYEELGKPLSEWVDEEFDSSIASSDSSFVQVSLTTSSASSEAGRSQASYSVGMAYVTDETALETLFSGMSIYSDTSSEMGAGYFSSLPPGVKANRVGQLTREDLKEQFPYLNEAIKSESGGYTLDEQRLSDHLFTMRVLRSLDKHIEYLIKEKKENRKKVHIHIRLMFASIMDRLLTSMDTRKKTIELLDYLWNHAWEKGTLQVGSGQSLPVMGDAAASPTHMVGVAATSMMPQAKGGGSYTGHVYDMIKVITGSPWDEQIFNTFQNLARYLGPKAVKVLMPGGQSESVVHFVRRFPTAYSIVQFTQDDELCRWWMRNYMQTQYVARGGAAIAPGMVMSDSHLESTVRPGIGGRGMKMELNDLVLALVQELKTIYPQTTFDAEFVANGLIHALTRQRKLLYSITRPFYPGKRSSEMQVRDKYYINELTVSQGNNSNSDLAVNRILKELNQLVAKQSDAGPLASHVLMTLIEAPLSIFILDQSVTDAKSRSQSVDDVFKWFASISEHKDRQLYLDSILTEWPAFHYLPEVVVSSPLLGPEKLNTAFCQVVSRVKPFCSSSAMVVDEGELPRSLREVMASKNHDVSWINNQKTSHQDVDKMLMQMTMQSLPVLIPKALPSAKR